MSMTDETTGGTVEWFGTFTPGNRVHLWTRELGVPPVTALGPAVADPSGKLNVALAIGGPGLVPFQAHFTMLMEWTVGFVAC
jgi:hypothetical protein